MRKIIIIVTASIFLLLTANLGMALRCGTNIVSVGDTKYEVIKRCGQPVFKEFLGVEKSKQYARKARTKSTSYEKVEVWIYDAKSLGSTSWDYQLIFVGMELVSSSSICSFTRRICLSRIFLNQS
jgi:hypothetical protein